MIIVVACFLIYGFSLPGWLYSIVALVGLFEFGLRYYFMKQTFEECLAEFAKKAAEYNEKQNKK